AMATGRHLPITVDTYERTVYLTGGVQTSDVKRQAEEIALLVPNVALVVNNLHVIRLTPAASPRTEPATLGAARVLAGAERPARRRTFAHVSTTTCAMRPSSPSTSMT